MRVVRLLLQPTCASHQQCFELAITQISDHLLLLVVLQDGRREGGARLDYEEVDHVRQRDHALNAAIRVDGAHAVHVALDEHRNRAPQRVRVAHRHHVRAAVARPHGVLELECLFDGHVQVVGALLESDADGVEARVHVDHLVRVSLHHRQPGYALVQQDVEAVDQRRVREHHSYALPRADAQLLRRPDVELGLRQLLTKAPEELEQSLVGEDEEGRALLGVEHRQSVDVVEGEQTGRLEQTLIRIDGDEVELLALGRDQISVLCNRECSNVLLLLVLLVGGQRVLHPLPLPELPEHDSDEVRHRQNAHHLALLARLRDEDVTLTLIYESIECLPQDQTEVEDDHLVRRRHRLVARVVHEQPRVRVVPVGAAQVGRSVHGAQLGRQLHARRRRKGSVGVGFVHSLLLREIYPPD
ncbi:hypothetical protein PFISCL1PPCAC_25676, partial [Pristionchus fissidentatus]